MNTAARRTLEHKRCARCEEHERRREMSEMAKKQQRSSSQRRKVGTSPLVRSRGAQACDCAGSGGGAHNTVGAANGATTGSAGPVLDNGLLPFPDVLRGSAGSFDDDMASAPAAEASPLAPAFTELERCVQETLRQSREDLRCMDAPASTVYRRERVEEVWWHPAAAALSGLENPFDASPDTLAAADDLDQLYPEVAESAAVLRALREIRARDGDGADASGRRGKLDHEASPTTHTSKSRGGASDSPTPSTPTLSATDSLRAGDGADMAPQVSLARPGTTIVDVLSAVERTDPTANAGDVPADDTDVLRGFHPKRYVDDLLRGSVSPSAGLLGDDERTDDAKEGGDALAQDDDDLLEALLSFSPEITKTLHRRDHAHRSGLDEHVFQHRSPAVRAAAEGFDPDEVRYLLRYRLQNTSADAVHADSVSSPSPGAAPQRASSPPAATQPPPADAKPTAPPAGEKPARSKEKGASKAEKEAERHALVRLIIESLPPPTTEIPRELREEIARQRRLLEHLTHVQQDHLRRITREQQAETRRRLQAPRTAGALDLRTALSPEQRRLGLQNVIEPYEIAQQLVAADQTRSPPPPLPHQRPVPPVVNITAASPNTHSAPPPFETSAEREAKFYEMELYRVRDEYRGQLEDERAKRRMESRAFAEMLRQQAADMERLQRGTIADLQRAGQQQQRTNAELMHQLTQQQAALQDRRLEAQERRHESRDRHVVDEAVGALQSAAATLKKEAAPSRAESAPRAVAERARNRRARIAERGSTTNGGGGGVAASPTARKNRSGAVPRKPAAVSRPAKGDARHKVSDGGVDDSFGAATSVQKEDDIDADSDNESVHVSEIAAEGNTSDGSNSEALHLPTAASPFPPTIPPHDEVPPDPRHHATESPKVFAKPGAKPRPTTGAGAARSATQSPAKGTPPRRGSSSAKQRHEQSKDSLSFQKLRRHTYNAPSKANTTTTTTTKSAAAVGQNISPTRDSHVPGSGTTPSRFRVQEIISLDGPPAATLDTSEALRRTQEHDDVAREELYRQQYHLIQQFAGEGGAIPVTDKEAYQALTVAGRSAVGRPLVMLGPPSDTRWAPATSYSVAELRAAQAFDRERAPLPVHHPAGPDGAEEEVAADYYALGADSSGAQRDTLWKAYRQAELRVRALERGEAVSPGATGSQADRDGFYQVVDPLAKEDVADAVQERVHMRPTTQREVVPYPRHRRPRRAHTGIKNEGAEDSGEDDDEVAPEPAELLEARAHLAALRRALLLDGSDQQQRAVLRLRNPLPASYHQLASAITSETVHSVLGRRREERLFSELLSDLEREMLSAVLESRLADAGDGRAAATAAGLQGEESQGPEGDVDNINESAETTRLRHVLEGYLEAAVLQEMMRGLPDDPSSPSEYMAETSAAQVDQNPHIPSRLANVVGDNTELLEALANVGKDGRRRGGGAVGEPRERVRVPPTSDSIWRDADLEVRATDGAARLPSPSQETQLRAYAVVEPAVPPAPTATTQTGTAQEGVTEGTCAAAGTAAVADDMQAADAPVASNATAALMSLPATEASAALPPTTATTTAALPSGPTATAIVTSTTTATDFGQEVRIVLDMQPLLSHVAAAVRAPPVPDTLVAAPNTGSENKINEEAKAERETQQRRELDGLMSEIREGARQQALREELLFRRELSMLTDAEAATRDTIHGQETIHRHQLWMMSEWALAAAEANRQKWAQQTAAVAEEEQKRQQLRGSEATGQTPPPPPLPVGGGADGVASPIRDPVTRFILEWVQEYDGQQRLRRQQQDILGSLRSAAATAAAADPTPATDGTAAVPPQSSTTETSSESSSWLSSTNPSSYGAAGGHHFLRARERMVAIPSTHRRTRHDEHGRADRRTYPEERPDSRLPSSSSSSSLSSATTRHTNLPARHYPLPPASSTTTTATRTTLSDSALLALTAGGPWAARAAPAPVLAADVYARLAEGFSSSTSSASAVPPPPPPGGLAVNATGSGPLPLVPQFSTSRETVSAIPLVEQVRQLQSRRGDTTLPPPIFHGHELLQPTTHGVPF